MKREDMYMQEWQFLLQDQEAFEGAAELIGRDHDGQ